MSLKHKFRTKKSTYMYIQIFSYNNRSLFQKIENQPNETDQVIFNTSKLCQSGFLLHVIDPEETGEHPRVLPFAIEVK